ncbi:MAG: response regulator transcription factor [Gammaproteobacteria bacterium]|nr:response regulator transcription factor [Gammaproteobacteria bacterium]
MNIFVFSVIKKITEHFSNELPETNYQVHYFSSIDDLKSAIENETVVHLIYHLGLRENDEAEFKTIQSSFKQKLNTLVLTNTPNPEQGVRLLNLNIRGYANTYLEHDKLIMALSVIQQGDIWAGASLIEYMLSKTAVASEEEIDVPAVNTTSVFHLLTTREQQIAQNILMGLQNKVIADELSITERTVKAHLSMIFKKLEVRNRLELTLKLQQADRRTTPL